MGVNDHGKICPTDGLDNKFCPGYFGHIELAKIGLSFSIYGYNYVNSKIGLYKVFMSVDRSN